MSIETPIAEMLAERFLEEREIMKFKKLVDASFFEMCISNRIGELIYGNKKYLDFIGVDSLEGRERIFQIYSRKRA